MHLHLTIGLVMIQFIAPVVLIALMATFAYFFVEEAMGGNVKWAARHASAFAFSMGLLLVVLTQ